MEIAAPWILSVIGSLWIGSYFSPYLRKRAENLATHDDLEKLINQVRATTEATKRIEARISNEVWNKQQLWEMKRDTVISVIQTMDATKDALMRYAAKRVSVAQAGADPNRFEIVIQASLLWTERIAEFESKRAVAALICSKRLSDALLDVQQALRGGYSDLRKGKISSYDDIGAVIRDRIIVTIALSRDELGIPAIASSQSDASTVSAPS